MAKSDKYEKEINESYENNEWQPVKDFSQKKKKYQELAKVHLRKEKRINIRISEKDLEDIQKKAIMQGLPYQTLIASIIHKYNSVLLTEKND
jgi:predicted DNA binding CopG/RHH family protein